MDLIDFWRAGNIILGSVAFVALTVDLKKHYTELSRRRLYLTFALMMLVFATIVASLEAIFQATPLGFRTSLYTVACIWTLFGLWISRNDPS